MRGRRTPSLTSYDMSDVVSDLETMKLSTGEAFNIDNYPDKNNQDLQPQLIAVNEVGFSETEAKASKYSIYFYVYNPRTLFSQAIESLVGTDTVDQYAFVSFEAAFNTEENHFSYKNQSLKLIDVSDDGRFFKYKYECPSDLYALMKGKSKRIYRVDSFNMLLGATVNSVSLYSFGADQKYVFAGESVNKVVTYYDSPYIHLDLNSTNYRTKTSNFGENYRNDIFTVYFAVPNSYFRDYDQLYAVRAVWNECKTGPVIVTDDSDVYVDAQSNMIGQFSYTSSSTRPSLVWDYTSYASSPLLDVIISKYSWNNPPTENYAVGTRWETLNSVIEAPKYIKFESDIKDYFFNITPTEYEDVKASEAGLKEFIVSNTDCLNVESLYNGERWKQFFFGGHVFGVDEVDIELSPFYYVQESDLAGYDSSIADPDNSVISDRLFIRESHVKRFYNFYQESVAADKRVVLFRFALKPYYAAKALYHYYDSAPDGLSNRTIYDHVEVCETYFYKDFDILDLRFQKEDVVYIFPVEADPIDIYPGFDDNYDNSDSTNDALKDFFGGAGKAAKEAFNLLLWILGIVLIVTLVLIFWKPIKKLVKLIVDFFKERKNRKKNE